MVRNRAFGSRLVAIFASCCAMLAVGCGSNDDDASAATSPIPASGAATNAEPGGDSEDADARAKDASAPSEGDAAHPTNPCPVLTYPSGVKIQTFENAAMTASYAHHLATGEAAPTCFLDVDNLVDPETGVVSPITVNVAAHFTLDELVGTEVSEGYGHIVLMKPAAVASLEDFRDTLDTPVSVISGFRSPKHQEDVCNSLCGDPLGCDGTCANNSRHMFGDAFDLPLEFYTASDEQLACKVGFKFAYLESGTHLHVDQNPDYATCVVE